MSVFPAQLRHELQCGIPSVVWERQHLSKERHILDRCRGLREQGIELVEFRAWRVAMQQSGRAFHLAYNGIKGAIHILRGTEIPQPRVRFGAEAFQQRGRQARFADSGLAGNQNDLAFSGICFRPAPEQQFGFFLSPDEGRQLGRVQRLEAALHGARPEYCPRSRRPG
jgi:hypothetical protein